MPGLFELFGLPAEKNSDKASQKLLGACISGNQAEFEQALAEGADVNFTRTDMPCVLASMANGHFMMARELINRGANVNCSNRHGWTPLHAAVKGDQRDLAEAILNAEALVNSGDITGETPLMTASVFGFSDLAALLLSRGADAAAVNADGERPLLLAAREGHEAICKILSQTGKARADAPSKSGETAISCAKTPEIKALLEKLDLERDLDIQTQIRADAAAAAAAAPEGSAAPGADGAQPVAAEAPKKRRILKA